jgi:hypothetical protein
MKSKTIVKRANDLARTFYKMRGYQVPADFKFWRATHPDEAGCWLMAKEAFMQIRRIDVEDALADIDEETIDARAETKRLMMERFKS